MTAFTEVKEVKPKASPENQRGSKAFENAKNKEVKEPRHISTINEHLEGKKHPETGVPFVKRVIILNWEKVEGVFPKFDSKFDTYMPPNMWKASDLDQFKYCTERLKNRIARDPEFAKQFTPRQLEQIKNGEPRISGLTWHHNETPGKMQLVNADIHIRTNHTGGRSLWGGGVR